MGPDFIMKAKNKVKWRFTFLEESKETANFFYFFIFDGHGSMGFSQGSPVMRGTESLLSEGPFLYESVATVVT